MKKQVNPIAIAAGVIFLVALLAVFFMKTVSAKPDAGITIPTGDLDKDGASAKRANMKKNQAAEQSPAPVPDNGK